MDVESGVAEGAAALGFLHGEGVCGLVCRHNVSVYEPLRLGPSDLLSP